MVYRTALEVKKAIIRLLKEQSHVLGQLERKVGTADSVIKRQVAELEYLGIVKVKKHAKNAKTGRPYTTVELTEYGRKI